MQLTVSAVARDITERTGQVVAPQSISVLFYQRKLDDASCPIVGRMRLIPADYVPVIEAALRKQGVITAVQTETVGV